MINVSSDDCDPKVRFLAREFETHAAAELIIDDRQMHARILGDGRQLKKGPQFDTTLQLDNGLTATLAECVRLSLGRAGPAPDAWLVESVPNLIVLGPRAWTDGEVRQLLFTFTEASNALHYGAHVADTETEEAAPANTISTLIPRHIEVEKLNILSVNSNGYEVSIELQMTGSLDALEPGLVFTPFVRIQSAAPRTFSDIHRFACQVLTFFEVSVGARSRMRSIRISSQLLEDQKAAFDKDHSPPEFFEVRLQYGDWSRAARLHPGDAIFSVYSEEQRNRTQRALQQWLDRLTKWETSYALASFYLGRVGTFDRDRLLRACAWFEALPLDTKSPNLTDEQVLEITEAAQAAAKSINRDDLLERIEGLLSNLKQKPLKQQVLDVCAALRVKFGEHAVPFELDRHLPLAASLRSRASHGRRAFNDDDAEKMITATRALEAICLMATIDGLTETSGFDSPFYGHHPLMGYVLEHQ